MKSKPTDGYSAERVDAVLSGLLASSKWHKTYKDFYHLPLDLESVCVLSYLMDAAWLFNAIKNDGWFYMTVDFLEKRLHLQRKVQTRILTKIKEAGYIRVTKRGMPARRFIRINYGKLMQDLLDVANKSTDGE